ncbi:unnamed protein product [Triticum turgidum subsp. durum]|uniref:Isopenicillin N synthase-like Fe(2+) 2OG dioxygenase domain-containing protein n=1 Tax=Triticum turgidum subsp. durum TaxID=4567 RepID=A0A9R0Y2F9_TRITD|nr:unnamed protein product [Triticum turgidum subsp. durum]
MRWLCDCVPPLRKSLWIPLIQGTAKHCMYKSETCTLHGAHMAWSNNRYKSVEHKVVTNATTERYSVAYFLCPSYDSPIGACEEPSPYRTFTFGEYRRRVQEDVKKMGKKIGLPNFLL